MKCFYRFVAFVTLCFMIVMLQFCHHNYGLHNHNFNSIVNFDQNITAWLLAELQNQQKNEETRKVSLKSSENLMKFLKFKFAGFSHQNFG